MKLLVTFAHRFLRTPNGNIYTRGTVSYEFLSRYLTVFDELVVLARIEDVPDPPSYKRADGPRVDFIALPYYYGPVEFLMNYLRIRDVVKIAAKAADAFILRVAGYEATMLFNCLRKNKTNFALEVVADPWDALSKGSVKSKLRPFIRYKMRRDLVRQCRLAHAAAYVTEYSLQRRYPPGCWATHYSTIDLSKDAILSETVIKQRSERIISKIESKEALLLICTGQMSQLYKGQDILISAISECLNDGFHLELLLLGDGKFRAQLERQAMELSISKSVRFVGNVPAGNDVFKYLDQADLFVLPSRQEGLPRAVIEAMARGLPCIGSTVGGFVELIGTQSVVPPNDIKTLARKIKELVEHPEKMTALAKANLAKAQEYCFDILNVRRTEFYKKVYSLSIANRLNGTKRCVEENYSESLRR